MPNPHGEHIWYELLTSDADAAASFYSDVIGWTVADSGMTDTDYRLFGAPDGDQVGGLMTMPDGMPGGPIWIGYVGVDDVDASVAAIEAAGGTIHMPAMDVAGVGRMAMVADPQGASFYVMRGVSEENSRAFLPSTADSGDETVGHGVWNELASRDAAAALDFYHDRFGWTQDGAMPMGDLGDYRFIRGPRAVLGAFMDTPPGAQPSWKYYFHVAEIDAALAKVAAGGGSVKQGPDPIPGGSYSATIVDPQGAVVGLVGRRRQGR